MWPMGLLFDFALRGVQVFIAFLFSESRAADKSPPTRCMWEHCTISPRKWPTVGECTMKKYVPTYCIEYIISPFLIWNLEMGSYSHAIILYIFI